MIVRMKELFLFTLASSVEDTIHKLGELGVVEIRAINSPASDFLDRCSNELDRTGQALSLLADYDTQGGAVVAGNTENNKDPRRAVNRILIAQDFRQQGQRKLRQLQEQMEWYKTWGEQIQISDFNYLSQRGIFIRLYKIDKEMLPAIAEQHQIEVFQEQNDGQMLIALLTRKEDEQLEFREEQLPELPVELVKQQLQRKERQLKKVEQYLQEQAQNTALLEEYQKFLQNALREESAKQSMGDIKGQLRYLRGFIPKNAVKEFETVAQQKNWGYQISEPENPEEVPVYIKNPSWVKLINPVMKFIDIVPGYKEVDVSIYFLVAFALFFAMLVGDAGYGAVFLILTLLFSKKLPAQVRFLVYVLSGSTIIWGVLSGTYFGSEQIAAIPFFNNLIVEEIASFGSDNVSFMMHLSFLIGAIHLTIAHSIRFVQFINSLRCLSEIGWIALIWGLFFVTENLVLGKALPPWIVWLFGLGVLLVTFFTREGKTFFGSMLMSVANLPLSLINGFSDIVSYVRLFAVGLATAAVAASFNSIIIPQGGFSNMGFLELLVAALALALGHGLNIALALMAVMVHGIRLNMLEFASHLGVQFSGQAYRPFKLLSYDKAIENGKEKLK